MIPLTVKLVSMPFAPLEAPSLGLTQLRGALQRQFGERVPVDIHYATFDLAQFIPDPALYQHALSSTGFLTHFGDWFFSRSAFPDAPDNAQAYLERYVHGTDEDSRQVRDLVARHRSSLEGFLDLVIDRHRLLEARVVGLTSMFLQNNASFALARRIKERNPGVITVMGGSACEGVTGLEFARQVPSLDFVFSGPGLVSFPAFIGQLLEGTTDGLHRINGVFSKANHGEFGAGASPIGLAMLGDEADINDVLPLDYDAFLRQFEEVFPNGDTKPYLLFETSRGCWWGDKSVCSFCGLNGSSPCHSAMTPATAIRQIQSLYPYAKRAHCFVATDNILPRQYPGQVFARLRPPRGFRMKYETRVDLEFPELQQLQKAGVVALQPGIESLSTATLALMRKGTTAFQNLRFLKDCARLGITLEWNLLLGSPGEPVRTFETYLRVIPLLHHLPPPQGAFPVMFVRYSRYHEQAGSLGLALTPHEFYSDIFPFEPQALERIATFFVNSAPDAPDLDPWLERVNAAIFSWKERWSNSDGREPVGLRLLGDGGPVRIVDTRWGELRGYEIGSGAARLLELLERPKSLARLQAETAGTGIDAEGGLAWLRERDLLFEEDGQYLSLVQPG